MCCRRTKCARLAPVRGYVAVRGALGTPQERYQAVLAGGSEPDRDRGLLARLCDGGGGASTNGAALLYLRSRLAAGWRSGRRRSQLVRMRPRTE